MKLRVTLLTTAFAMAVAVSALANQCPSDIKKIDAALAMANVNLSQEQMGEVKRLRDEGQRLHERGDHQQSMATLATAKQMLGVM